MAGHSLELTVDLYNLLNMVNRNWGQYRATFNNNHSVPMLRLVGYDLNQGRGVCQLALPARNQIVDLPSRCQAEISARYTF
jgi:hypothetical protein